MQGSGQDILSGGQGLGKHYRNVMKLNINFTVSGGKSP